MSPRTALLIVLLLAGGAGIYLLLGSGATIAPDDPNGPATAPVGNAGDPTTATGTGATDATTASTTPTTIRDAADTAGGAVVPVPDDAEWIEVRVVAAATGEPIASAEVWWFDDTVTDWVGDRPELVPEAEQQVQRDIEDFASRFGWRTQSDANGIARVHQTRTTEVVARSGKLFGSAEVGNNLVPPADGFRVTLVEDREFAVQVLTADETPAIGVPIMVTIQREGSTRTQLLRYQSLAATRAPDGIARLRHVQDWPESLPKDVAYTLRVRTALPGHQDEGVELVLDELPTDPIVMRLPTTGTVLVRIDVPEANPMQTATRIQLREAGPTTRRRASASRRAGPDGWARFEHIATNATLRAVGYVDGGSVSADVTGPATPGGTVEVVLRADGDAIRLVGRLLGTDGQPVAGTRFSLRLNGRRTGRFTLTTDDDGRFHALVGAPRSNDRNQVDRITAVLQQAGERPLTASVGARELRSGIQNLGDFRLALPPLIVAGRCTMNGEPAALSSGSRIEYEHRRENRDPRWRRVSNTMLYASDDGTFAYYGETSHDRLRLTPRGEHLPAEPIPFRRGQRDLRVELTSGSAVVATILLDQVGWLRPIARLVRTSPPANGTAGTDSEPVVARLNSRDDDRFQARWRELVPGTFDLEIALPGIIEPLVRIPDVQVPQPPGGDPRLIDIDLQSRCRVQVIRLFEFTGAPLEHASRRLRGGLFPIGQPDGEDLVGAQYTGHESKMLLPAAQTEVLVAVAGYRPTTVLCTGEPVDVRLDRWPSVQLTLPDLPALGEEFELAVRLLPSGDRRRYRAGWARGNLRYLMAPPETAVKFENGVAELFVDDTLRRAQVVVRRGRSTMGVKMPEVHVSSTTGGRQMPVTAEAVEAAAKLLRRD